MKKLSLLFTLVTLTSLLLSSCSRLENITVSKRQHRSGYYVDLGSRKNVTPKSKPKAMAKVEPSKVTGGESTVAPQITTSLNNVIENTSTISTSLETKAASPSTLAKKAEKKKQAVKEKSDNVYASTMDNSDVRELSKLQRLKKNVRAFSEAMDVLKAPSAKEDVPFWLLIVLCIILPPLAVYLKFGISTEFWISILLTLLFWIPGVIYALILILD